VESAFKRQDISIGNETTEFSSKFESLRFGIYSDCFDTEIGVGYVRRVEWIGKTVKTPRYRNQDRSNRVFSEIWKIAFCDLQGLFRH
jgi:hypothetical protein